MKNFKECQSELDAQEDPVYWQAEDMTVEELEFYNHIGEQSDY